MKNITITEALQHTSPQPVVLVCSQTPAGITNLAAVAWWTYLESEPPMLGFSMSKESYTAELVAKNGMAVLSVPGEAIAAEAFQCGCVSGRTVNKAEKFGIDMVEAPVGFPVHSRLVFVCRLDKTVTVGDCIFFVCDIDDIFYNAHERQLFAWGGSEKLAPVLNG